MRLCVSLSRGVAAPLGCVIFFQFCRNCDLYAMRACARHGRYHYPQRALRAAETPDGRLLKRLSCRFLTVSGLAVNIDLNHAHLSFIHSFTIVAV